MNKRFALILMLMAFTPSYAEKAPPDPPKRDPLSELKLAYQKELAYLQAEKRSLTKQLAQHEKEASQNVKQAKASLQSLRQTHLNLIAELEETKSRHQNLVTNREEFASGEGFANSVVEQARSLTKNPPSVSELPLPEALSEALNGLLAQIEQGSKISEEPGEFFTPEGNKVQGTIVNVGHLFKFGEAKDLKGPLVQRGSLGAQLVAGMKGFEEQRKEPLMEAMIWNEKDPYEPEDQGSEIFATVEAGGVIGGVILGLGLFAAGLLLWRAFFIHRSERGFQKTFQDVAQCVKTGHLTKAQLVCQKRSEPLSRVLSKTLGHLRNDRETLENAVSEQMIKESSGLDRFATFITVSAAVAPLLGLLGTVTGMIATFDMIRVFGTGDPKLLSGGISEALVTTMLGLIVAIPTLFFGHLLSARADRLKEQLERAVLQVVNMDHYRESEGGPA